MAPPLRIPLSPVTLKMLAAVGLLYLIMMGSTFSSLGVVLPHMVASLHLNWEQAGFGFTLLALAAGLASLLPALTIRRWGGRATLALGVAAMVLAYATLALCDALWAYDLGALLLGLGFALIGAVPGLHILNGWEDRHRSLVFGAYLACGGLGGALWPSIVEAVIAATGDWRRYWAAMAVLMTVVGIACLAVVRERAAAGTAADDAPAADGGWTLADAVKTPQFYVIGCAIAATYLVASTVNAFTVSYLTMKGVSTAAAVVTFSIQSACHAAFPLLMGGLAGRVKAKTLLALGVVLQVAGMAALALSTDLSALMVFAIGVGGGYGTVFLATTLSLQAYFGHRHYAPIFGANQMFTTISVVGPAIIGWAADLTGRFDLSFAGCALLLLAAAIAAAALRPPQRAAVLVAAAQG